MDIFKANKGVMKKEQVVRKEFNYDQDNTKLNFTLRVDIKKELVLWKPVGYRIGAGQI